MVDVIFYTSKGIDETNHYRFAIPLDRFEYAYSAILRKYDVVLFDKILGLFPLYDQSIVSDYELIDYYAEFLDGLAIDLDHECNILIGQLRTLFNSANENKANIYYLGGFKN